MKDRKLFATIVLVVVSSLMLAGCTPDEQVVSDVVNQVEEIDASEATPTIGVNAEDRTDQNLLNELNQYQDKSLDSDFSEIESKL